MVSRFLADNAQWVNALDAPPLRARRDALVRRLQQALTADGGALLRLHPVQMWVDPDELRRLGADLVALSRLQTRLLSRMLEAGRPAVAAAFEVPADMLRFVNWEELCASSYFIGRYDLLHDGDGFRCCEANIDSCVAAAEVFDVALEYMVGLGMAPHPRLSRPLDALAAFVVERAREASAERIVILDTSTDGGSGGKGYLSFERFRAAIARCGTLPVHIADDRTYDTDWIVPSAARRTFVHRGFMMQQAPDHGAFLERLLDAGTVVRSTYESEIRSDKLWFALFYEALDAGALSDQEARLVRRLVPRTERVTGDNAERLIAAKDKLVFKACRSFGGTDILIGDETGADELRSAFTAGRYIAQTLLHLPMLSFPHVEGTVAAPQHMVFGLYQYGESVHGLLVRGSMRSRVVNVTVGDARLAWALALPADARFDFERHLAKARA